jgi:penicillin-binding protein 1B
MYNHPRAALAIAAIIAVVGGAGAAVSADAVARAHLGDGIFATPTRFYARPLVFYPGMELDRRRTENYLERLGYREVRSGRVGIGEFRLGSWEWTIGRRAFRLHDRLDPGGVTRVRVGWGGRVAEVRDAENRRLELVAVEPEQLGVRYGPLGEDRVPVLLGEVPDVLLRAVLAIEDQHFFQHHGLDARRVAGAALANMQSGHIVQGASTITQQLAKNLFLTPRRTVRRKLRELAMAFVLEARYSKERILEAYLNQVYLGQEGGRAIHGVGRAAQYYFGKDVTQLRLHEAALLAGMIRGPNLYSPFRSPEAAADRRNLVLVLMRNQGVISQEELEDARDAGLGLRERAEPARHGRYFVDFVAQQLREEHGAELMETGLAVFTTLDMELQRAAEHAVAEGLKRLEGDYPALAAAGSPLQAALVVLDPRTGEILAMVGGRDYGASQFNRAADARRQPGSAFKPVVAMAALSYQEDGPPSFTLASVLEDEPLEVETPAGIWQPANYDGRFRGSLTLREALERSLNVPFARLGLAVGPERIVRTARLLGIQSPLRPYPSIALGAFEVSPLELTRAYGTLAAGGYRADMQTLLGVATPSGEVLNRIAPDGERVYQQAEAYLVTSALRGAVERGTGRGLRANGFRGPVAAKSGTTSDFRDGWFVGYTSSLAVGVWVGFDDGTSVELPGSRVALPIFARFLSGVFGSYGEDEFRTPRGVEVVDVDRETGLRGGPGCRGEPEVFLRGTAPERSCSRYWSWSREGSRFSREFNRRVRPLVEQLGRLRRNRD